MDRPTSRRELLEEKKDKRQGRAGAGRPDKKPKGKRGRAGPSAGSEYDGIRGTSLFLRGRKPR